MVIYHNCFRFVKRGQKGDEQISIRYQKSLFLKRVLKVLHTRISRVFNFPSLYNIKQREKTFSE